jgi:hypothetical protein
MNDNIEMIVEALKQKACLKQQIFRTTQKVFSEMKQLAEGLAEDLAGRFQAIDEFVIIEYKDIGEFEFHMKFSGDLLIFTMHSNIVTFPPDHLLSKNPWVNDDPRRGYFGHIMVYNFMADSFKYNRLNDPGYLLARMMLNLEEHFYIEGVRQLNFLHPDVSKNKVNSEILLLFIEAAMVTAIGHDLFAPNYQDIQVMPLGAKLQNQMASNGHKVGFQMVHAQG